MYSATAYVIRDIRVEDVPELVRLGWTTSEEWPTGADPRRRDPWRRRRGARDRGEPCRERHRRGRSVPPRAHARPRGRDPGVQADPGRRRPDPRADVPRRRRRRLDLALPPPAAEERGGSARTPAACCSPFPTSPRVATERPSTPSAPRSAPGSSTHLPTLTTIARCSRSRVSPGRWQRHVADAARVAVERVDLTRPRGRAPARGRDRRRADRVPRRRRARRGGRRGARARGHARAELGLPVFLYGALAGGRTRAELRKGGPQALQERIDPASCARRRPCTGCTPPPAPCSSPRARRWRRSTSRSPPRSRRRRRSRRRSEGGSEAARRARARPAARPARDRSGLDQHRGPHGHHAGRRRRAPSSATRASRAPSSSRPPRGSAFESFPAEIPLRGAPLLD